MHPRLPSLRGFRPERPVLSAQAEGLGESGVPSIGPERAVRIHRYENGMNALDGSSR